MDKETWEVIKAIQEKQKETLDTDISIYENFRAMYFFDGAQLRYILSELRGAKLRSRLQDIEFMIRKMESNIQKLKQVGKSYLDTRDEILVEDFTEYCYLYSSYMYSITIIYVEYLNNEFLPESYTIQRENIFGEEGIREHFIIKDVIRNASIHGKLYKPSWLISYNYPQPTTIQITLEKRILLLNKNAKDKKEYFEHYDEHIDIVKLFESYLQKVKNFFEWYQTAVYVQYSDELKLYDDYVNQLKALQQESIHNLKKQRENQ